jgi:hypothetical protein
MIRFYTKINFCYIFCFSIINLQILRIKNINVLKHGTLFELFYNFIFMRLFHLRGKLSPCSCSWSQMLPIKAIVDVQLVLLHL